MKTLLYTSSLFSEVAMSEAVVVDKMDTGGLLDAAGKNSRQLGGNSIENILA